MHQRFTVLILIALFALMPALAAGCANGGVNMQLDVTFEELTEEIMTSDEVYGTLCPLESEYYTSIYGANTDTLEEYASYEGFSVSSVIIFLAMMIIGPNVDTAVEIFEGHIH